MKLCLLLVLCLPAVSLAMTCSAGATRDSGCLDCVDNTATSDCNWCKSGYYKTGPKACTICPDGMGRRAPSSAVSGTETSAVCFKCAPQLKCKNCGSDPFSCSECATGSLLEGGYMFDKMYIQGCSTDCKSFSTNSLVPLTRPNPATSPEYCTGCPSNCVKCEFTSTLKGYVGEPAPYSKENKLCTQCDAGHYIQPNNDPTVVPSCSTCGANCKKCKDRTECNECFPGWAFDGSAKDACTKAVAASARLLQGALVSILALFLAW